MKRYLCIVLIVTAALMSSGKGGWNISGNAIQMTINVSGK